MKDITDNKIFWKTVKPFLSNNGCFYKQITLIEGEKIISEDKEVAEKLGNYFEKAVKSLDINEDTVLLTSTIGIYDTIDIIIKKYEKHPSILAIKGKIVLPQQKFTFMHTELADMEKEVKSLNGKKATTFNSIVTKLLKYTFDICGPTLYNIWCDAVMHCTFPNKLKIADITPIFKTGDNICANNYRPISVLPVVSKYLKELCRGK